MKVNLGPKLLIISIFITISTSLFSQTAITRSDSITVINNKQYFVHIVEAKQTLYSISKAYKTTVEEIVKINPEAKNGLSINQNLFIPTGKEITNLSSNKVKHTVRNGESLESIAELYKVPIDTIIKYNPESKTLLSVNQLLLFPIDTKIDKDPNFIYHKVKPKETLYGISRLYGVKTKVIEKYNAHLQEKGLQIGEEIKIPKEKIESLQSIPKSKQNLIYHKVERKQTLYSIAQIYEIEISQIVEANADLQNRGIITGEILKIPIGDYLISNDTLPGINQDSIVPKEIEEYDCIVRNINSERTINVALMLPLYTSINELMQKPKEDDEESESNNSNDDDEIKIYHRSKMFIDFYQGCLIALNDLKLQGFDINLHVFDTENDTNRVKEIILKQELDNIDIILGPIFSENINLVSKYSVEKQKIIVSPLSVYNDFLDDNPFAFQLSPDLYTLSHYAADFLLNMPAKNFIVIHDRTKFDVPFAAPFKQGFFNLLHNRLDYSEFGFQEIAYYSAQDSILDYALISGKENVVIIPSSSQAFVSSVMSKLNAYHHEYEIKVFGMPRWRKFENIEPEIFHNLETHLYSNYYIDYNNKLTKEFIFQFRQNFKAEPNLYSYQAYDAFKFFVEGYNTFGNDLIYCVNNIESSQLVSKFEFKKLSKQKGLSNTAIYLLFYNHEYDVVKLNTSINE